MTLLIWFHQSHYRTFKAFYQHHVCIHLRGAFPGLVSYGRFVELIEHTRHRSLVNFMVNILRGLIAYCHQPKNPATAPIASGLTELTLVTNIRPQIFLPFSRLVRSVPNEESTMSTDSTPFPALTPSQRLHLEIYGYVVLEKLLTEAEIASLLEVIYQIEADFQRTGQLPGANCHLSSSTQEFSASTISLIYPRVSTISNPS